MPGILVVDDNANIRALLCTAIETLSGLKVSGEAANGVEAIQRARELAPDLVLIDFSMPLLDGSIAAAYLKRHMPQTKVVLFTLHVDILPKNLQPSTGVDLLIPKTDDIRQLPERLTRLLASDPPAAAVSGSK